MDKKTFQDSRLHVGFSRSYELTKPMEPPSKYLQLLGSLLDEAVSPGGDGLAVAHNLFSDEKFASMLEARRAFDAFHYLLPFLKRALTDPLETDDEDESQLNAQGRDERDGGRDPRASLWSLHDNLALQAMIDAKLAEDDEAIMNVFGNCLRRNQRLFNMLLCTAMQKQGSGTEFNSTPQLMELLAQVPALRRARANGRLVDSCPKLESLKDYVIRVEESITDHAKLRELELENLQVKMDCTWTCFRP